MGKAFKSICLILGLYEEAGGAVGLGEGLTKTDPFWGSQNNFTIFSGKA